MPRLFWRLFLSIWLTVVIFVAIMAAVSDHLTREATKNQDSQRQRPRLEMVINRLEKVLEEQGPRAAAQALQRAPEAFRNLVYIIHGEPHRELLGRHKQVHRLLTHRRVIRGLVKSEVTATDGKKYMIVAVPRLPVRVIWEPTPLGTVIRLIIAALVSALVSFFLARSLSSPLEQLRRGSQRLALGDLSARAGILGDRKDEFGRLARDFDRMATQLQALDRSRRRLLRDVSHELRSPLARLQVALELAKGKDSGNVQAELERIGLESRRLEELIDQVLTLLRESSATQPLERKEINLTHLLYQLAEQADFESNGGAGPMIDFQPQGDLMVSADHELLYRALENIIRNGIKYTDPAKGLKIDLSRTGTEVLISVRDFGQGVPPQALSHLFEPFYRVGEARDRDSGGYGLGLAIAQAAVERHGGSIKAENADGGGLRIEISLPLV